MKNVAAWPGHAFDRGIRTQQGEREEASGTTVTALLASLRAVNRQRGRDRLGWPCPFGPAAIQPAQRHADKRVGARGWESIAARYDSGCVVPERRRSGFSWRRRCLAGSQPETTVPTGSPLTTFTKASSAQTLTTEMGRLLSMHMAMAVLSITPRRILRASI